MQTNVGAVLPGRPAVASTNDLSPEKADVAMVSSKNSSNLGSVLPSSSPSQITQTVSSRSTQRYSVEKFKELDAYCSRLRLFRTVAVLVGVPLPALAISLVPSFLALQAVRDGPNAAFFLHSGIIAASSMFGLLLTWLEVTGLPRKSYSIPQLVVITAITTAAHCLIFALVTFHVVFPLPFSWITTTPPLMTTLVLVHVLVFRSRLWRDSIYFHALRMYGPSVVLQMSQVLLYPAISVLFDNVPPVWQIVLAVAFTVLKGALKKLLKKLSVGLNDFSGEVGVCGIEITASLYQ